MSGGPDHRPVWHYKIRLEDVWRNEQMSFTGRRDAVVGRLRVRAWFRESSNGSELRRLTDELAAAEDARTFDPVMEELYDWADIDRAWIGTLSASPDAT